MLAIVCKCEKHEISSCFNPIPNGGGGCPCPPPFFWTCLNKFWYDGTALFTKVPLKPYFEKMWKISSFFWIEKCLFLWFSPLILTNKKSSSHFRRETANENEQFKETKTWLSISFLTRQRIQGYRNKSDIVLFAFCMEGHLKLRLQALWLKF